MYIYILYTVYRYHKLSGLARGSGLPLVPRRGRRGGGLSGPRGGASGASIRDVHGGKMNEISGGKMVFMGLI